MRAYHGFAPGVTFFRRPYAQPKGGHWFRRMATTQLGRTTCSCRTRDSAPLLGSRSLTEVLQVLKMGNLRIRPILAAALLLFATRPLLAQLPSTSDAQALLQSRPDLVNQLRQRITTSGMTPDQIRSRLRAAGYPETMLDAYLPSSSGSASTSSRP